MSSRWRFHCQIDNNDAFVTSGHNGDRKGREGTEADQGDENTEGLQGN